MDGYGGHNPSVLVETIPALLVMGSRSTQLESLRLTLSYFLEEVDLSMFRSHPSLHSIELDHVHVNEALVSVFASLPHLTSLGLGSLEGANSRTVLHALATQCTSLKQLDYLFPSVAEVDVLSE